MATLLHSGCRMASLLQSRRDVWQAALRPSASADVPGASGPVPRDRRAGHA